MDVAASPERCVTAFVDAMTGKRTGLKPKARWKIARSGSTAAAEYEGRAGLASFAASLSEKSQFEAEAAIGSEIHFEATGEGAEGGGTRCAMWLGSRTNVGFGMVPAVFTADAKFFRGYMREVELRLRALDPSASTVKS